MWWSNQSCHRPRSALTFPGGLLEAGIPNNVWEGPQASLGILSIEAFVLLCFVFTSADTWQLSASQTPRLHQLSSLSNGL